MKYVFILIIIFSLLKCDSENEDLYTSRNDHITKLNISLPGSIQNPAFSPDGKTIVFTHFKNGYNIPPSDLCTFNLETHELRSLVNDGNNNVNLPGTCWNESKHLIVFSSDKEPHDEIYVINGSTKEKARITNRPDMMAYEPTFSPDGNWIVFESHRIDKEENGIITKYKSDGTSDFINLTDPGEDCRQPNWSPAGDKILYQKKERDQWNIWVMNNDGSDKRRITNFNGNKTDAVFTPDGQNIIFSLENETIDLADICKVSLTDNKPIKLTDFNGYEGAPAISPDGLKLIFESSSGDPDKSKRTTLWLLNL